MLGLGNYDSEEEDEVAVPETQTKPLTSTLAASVPPKPKVEEAPPVKASIPDKNETDQRKQDAVPLSRAQPPDAVSGPISGPSMPEMLDEAPMDEDGGVPLSPYSANRSAIRNYTMPPVPNFEIPPSPPGSPPLASTKKFAQFLQLKKQGVHFNQKLETSSALRNPALLKKLMGFAGIDEKDQYASTLPPELATPTEFPSWAYPEEIAKRQEQRRKNREKIEFVPAAASSSGSAGAQVSVAERVRAGLSRESSKSPAVSEGSRRKDTERSGGKGDASRTGFRSKSRSPRR